MVKVSERGAKRLRSGKTGRRHSGRSGWQQSFPFRTWGGKRKGAGRKQVNDRKSQPHRRRPEVTRSMGVLVTLRVVEDVRRMRRMDAYKALRKASLVVLARTNF